MLQVWLSVLVEPQGVPPEVGWMEMSLVLTLIPLPQDLLHWPHDDHSAQAQLQAWVLQLTVFAPSLAEQALPVPVAGWTTDLVAVMVPVPQVLEQLPQALHSLHWQSLLQAWVLQVPDWVPSALLQPVPPPLA